MSTFLQEELGVAMSGTKWEVANYTLWQSTRPDIVLFTSKQPRLARSSSTGRYQMGMSVHREQRDGTIRIRGGSAIFTITSSIQHDPRAFEELTTQWKTEMAAMGPAAPPGVRFIPLNTQKAEAVVLIDPSSGTPDPEHNNKDVGTPGGYSSFLVRLTEQGAQEWANGIRNKKAIPAGVKYSYEYLRMMPDVGATVRVHGSRVFTHLSTALKVSARYGFWYGGSAQINAAWENMVRNGDIEITFVGAGLPPELEAIRSEMVSTFANQARDQLFKAIFEPAPKVEDAQAGDTSGFFGGANFALKWKKQSESVDLNLTLRFKGWTWLRASMDADVTALFQNLDESYVNEVPMQVAFPASIVVDADPMLANTALSWSASEGAAPQAPVFGPEGGNATYTVTSQNPDDVLIRYKAKVNFVPRWPVIETSGEATTSAGGNQIVVKPSAWIGRHWIFLFVRDGDKIVGPSELNPDDHLVCNVSYAGSHLTSGAVKDSAKITPLEPLEFSYPLSPAGDKGEAKFSAFGVVNGTLVRSKEQTINFDEDAVFILVDPKHADQNKRIQLVSQSSVISESDRLANSLLRIGQNGARPLVEGAEGMPRELRDEIMRRRPRNGDEAGKKGNGHGTTAGDYSDAGDGIEGVLRAIEYSARYGAIILDTAAGTKRIRVRNELKEDLDRLDDKPHRVRVTMDPAGEYAERIAVIVV